jgi:hypothetical protein
VGSNQKATLSVVTLLAVAMTVLIGAGTRPAAAHWSPLAIDVTGPTDLAPGQLPVYGVSASGGTPPYAISCFKTTGSSVTGLPLSMGRVFPLCEGGETFNVVCDVVDAAGTFATDFVPVNVSGEDLPF